MTICYKMGNVQDTANSQDSTPFRSNDLPKSPSSYPKITNPADDHDYEIINPHYTPSRPAPGPPASPAAVITNTAGSCNTLGTYAALEGVPFVLNSRLTGTVNSPGLNALPVIRARPMNQLDTHYNYDFRAERLS